MPNIARCQVRSIALLLALACGGNEESPETMTDPGAATSESPATLAPSTTEAAATPAEGSASGESATPPALVTSSKEAPGASAGPRVTVAEGAVRGVTQGTVEQFLGIPFAAPPVGELRWAPPAPPAPWQGERDGSQVGPACLQPAAVPTGITGSEDCLTLNVYRPVDSTPRAPRAVLVWVHGGSFVIGAGSAFDPQRLVNAADIIVVTVNYRLGALGFLAVPPAPDGSGGLSGEYGLMDQQAALRWVQDNIAEFGGDPQQVTLSGQSAGGASVCAHLASPAATGLFSRAIIQSASCAAAPRALADMQGSTVANVLGCTDPAGAAECLRVVPAPTLLAATATSSFGVLFGGELVPRAPFAVVLAGEQQRVPMLVGGVRDEMRGFAALQYPLAAENYQAALAASFPGLSAEAIAAEYPLSDYNEPYDAYSLALSDGGAFAGGSLGGCVTQALADTLSASTSTYAYELDDPNFLWERGAALIPLPPGASHSTDLAYLFDPVGFVLSVPFTPPQTALAEQLVDAWGAFVQRGDPSSDRLGTWPLYDTTARQLLQAEPGLVRISSDFNERHHCAFWQALRAASAAENE